MEQDGPAGAVETTGQRHCLDPPREMTAESHPAAISRAAATESAARRRRIGQACLQQRKSAFIRESCTKYDSLENGMLERGCFFTAPLSGFSISPFVFPLKRLKRGTAFLRHRDRPVGDQQPACHPFSPRHPLTRALRPGRQADFLFFLPLSFLPLFIRPLDQRLLASPFSRHHNREDQKILVSRAEPTASSLCLPVAWVGWRQMVPAGSVVVPAGSVVVPAGSVLVPAAVRRWRPARFQ